MISQPLSDQLLLFFQRYLAFYREFLQLETVKYNDMTNNNLSTIDAHVKAEEAYLLKSKGLELERARLLEKTQCPKATFKELIPFFEEPVQGEIQKIYNELSGVLLDLKETNLRCNHLTELRLHRVQVDLKKLEKQPELQKVYNAQAREGNRSSAILSKKI